MRLRRVVAVCASVALASLPGTTRATEDKPSSAEAPSHKSEGMQIPSEPPPPAIEGMIERGAYLVKITGCNDCHTPLGRGPQGPEPDVDRMLSGHPEELKMPPPPRLPEGLWTWIGSGTNTAFAGPWGISYGTNLTPDKDTGIGAWTEQIFIDTMRTGRHWGASRPILPPMPWQNVARMTDEDLSSMFRYLTSIPPIKNKVPDAVVAPSAGKMPPSTK